MAVKKKAPAKKAAPKKVAKKVVAKKAPAKKAAPKKVAKKVVAKKAPAKKAAPKKVAKKIAAKKTPAKKVAPEKVIKKVEAKKIETKKPIVKKESAKKLVVNVVETTIKPIEKNEFINLKLAKSKHENPLEHIPEEHDIEEVAHEPLTPITREEPKIGRNDPCHCGSGLKYKKCHGK